MSSAGHRWASFKDWPSAPGLEWGGAGTGQEGWPRGHSQCPKGCIWGCQNPCWLSLSSWYCFPCFGPVLGECRPVPGVGEGEGRVLTVANQYYVPLPGCLGSRSLSFPGLGPQSPVPSPAVPAVASWPR